MDSDFAPCPAWLVKRLVQTGGSMSFHQFMDLALNDPINGAYSSGRLKIGKRGDFATSPSISSDFAELLATQLVDWFSQLDKINQSQSLLTLVEVGPGEGDLVFDLLRALMKASPSFINRLEIVLIELNQGMAERQRIKLQSLSDHIPIRWSSFEELSKSPVLGVIVAHEVLDSLPVERLVYRDKSIFRQGVSLFEESNESFLKLTDLPLNQLMRSYLTNINEVVGVEIPPNDVSNGWSSELHTDLSSWFLQASKALEMGTLLVIDYCIEAHRYYTKTRSSGTLMAYKNQTAQDSFLNEPGYWDLTSHLCLETLKLNANQNGWTLLGEVRQGLALLSLGLSERFDSLKLFPSNRLGEALSQREALLRLVDPVCLGEFRWLAFQKNLTGENQMSDISLSTRFLQDPIY